MPDIYDDYEEELKDYPDIIAHIKQGIASGACVCPNTNLSAVERIKRIMEEAERNRGRLEGQDSN